MKGQPQPLGVKLSEVSHIVISVQAVLQLFHFSLQPLFQLATQLLRQLHTHTHTHTFN